MQTCKICRGNNIQPQGRGRHSGWEESEGAEYPRGCNSVPWCSGISLGVTHLKYPRGSGSYFSSSGHRDSNFPTKIQECPDTRCLLSYEVGLEIWTLIFMAKVSNLGTWSHILSKWPCFPKTLMAGSSRLFSTYSNIEVLYFKGNVSHNSVP